MYVCFVHHSIRRFYEMDLGHYVGQHLIETDVARHTLLVRPARIRSRVESGGRVQELRDVPVSGGVSVAVLLRIHQASIVKPTGIK